MTLPIAHGFPDWGRYAAEVDVSWLEQVLAAVDVDTTYGPFFLGTARWLGMEVGASTQNSRVEFQFWRDSALSEAASRPTFDLIAPASFRGSIPVAGPYLTVLVRPNAAGLLATTRLWTAAGPLMALSQPDFNALLSSVGVGVPVGNSVIGPTDRIAPGPAVWYADVNVATWTASLQIARYDGTFRTFSLITSGVAVRTLEVWLPTTCVRILVNNATGGAGGGTFLLNSASLHASG